MQAFFKLIASNHSCVSLIVSALLLLEPSLFQNALIDTARTTSHNPRWWATPVIRYEIAEASRAGEALLPEYRGSVKSLDCAPAPGAPGAQDPRGRMYNATSAALVALSLISASAFFLPSPVECRFYELLFCALARPHERTRKDSSFFFFGWDVIICGCEVPRVYP